MAANYGMHLSDEDAQHIVDRWREANPWAIDFSRDLWEAMRAACDAPGQPYYAGRICFVFLSGYFGGTLLCRLPSGRFLTYRSIRWEWLDKLDDEGNVIEQKWELTFARGYGRIKLWPGFFVENVTQAVAADVLRGTLVRLHEDADWMPVRLHTHDEVLTETSRDRADEARDRLRKLMRLGFPWSKGLPLMSDETQAYYYTKHEGSHGL
jgi:hypothetical protein